MPGSDIEAFIEELEDLINNAKAPLAGGGSKKIIDADAAYEILDDIKGALPEEFQKARRILRERDEILDSAEEEAQHIVKDAQDKADTLASDQEIVRLANNQAEEIKRRADSEAREIRYWAENSAEQTFGKLEEELQGVIDKTNSLLSQMTYCRELLSGRGSNDERADGDEPHDED
ncbi:MAG: ATPase [Coriobacteriia bacterium]|nr:ATPase [Coriobacteriia bacterium]MBS5478441.1 ATPase [Coriobacteriia bacterium]